MVENITVSNATDWKRRRPLMPSRCNTENLKTFFHTITGLYFSSLFGTSVFAPLSISLVTILLTVSPPVLIGGRLDGNWEEIYCRTQTTPVAGWLKRERRWNYRRTDGSRRGHWMSSGVSLVGSVYVFMRGVSTISATSKTSKCLVMYWLPSNFINFFKP